MKNLIKTILTGLCITLLSMLFTLAVIEIAYRYQWVDFFSAELKQLNTPQELAGTRKKILVFGDSFSAQQDSYANLLKDSLSGCDVVNSAVSGTSMREMSLIAQHRIDEFKPEKIVLQLYVGNDLTDISHPYNLENVSLLRNLYWYASDKCWCLAWLNYKLAPARKLIDHEQVFTFPKTSDTFSVGGYSGRVKLLLKADSSFIDRSICLPDMKYQRSFEETVDYVRTISNYLHSKNPAGNVVVILIPHCTEINAHYRADYEKLGGAFLRSFDTIERPFYTQCKQQLKNMDVVDISDSLRLAEGVGIQTYYYSDEHLTPEGQKVVYRSIVNKLR